MYIKSLNKENNPVIINLNVQDAGLIYVEGNKLVFEMKERSAKGNILNKEVTLSSPEKANMAFESLFNTLGMKAPLGNILDLTNGSVVKNEPENMEDNNEDNEDMNDEQPTK